MPHTNQPQLPVNRRGLPKSVADMDHDDRQILLDQRFPIAMIEAVDNAHPNTYKTVRPSNLTIPLIKGFCSRARKQSEIPGGSTYWRLRDVNEQSVSRLMAWCRKACHGPTVPAYDIRDYTSSEQVLEDIQTSVKLGMNPTLLKFRESFLQLDSWDFVHLWHSAIQQGDFAARNTLHDAFRDSYLEACTTADEVVEIYAAAVEFEIRPAVAPCRNAFTTYLGRCETTDSLMELHSAVEGYQLRAARGPLHRAIWADLDAKDKVCLEDAAVYFEHAAGEQFINVAVRRAADALWNAYAVDEAELANHDPDLVEMIRARLDHLARNNHYVMGQKVEVPC